MRIVNKEGCFWVLPQAGDDFTPSNLLGCRQRKHDPWYIVEDNLVNRLVLGMHIPSIEPCSFNTEGLRDYQISDIEKMLTQKSVLNANPMGLGKTVEAIRYIEAVHGQSVLIVTPKIIRWQWVDQIKQWLNRDAIIYEKQKKVERGNIYIINYDKLRDESISVLFKSFSWDVLIVDEAHKIKNRTSQQTVAVKSIPAQHKIALTGTPILRYVDDLWSILHFLDSFYSGVSYWNFVNYFCVQQDSPWGNKIVGMTTNPFKLSILNRLLKTISVRNDSIEVAKGKCITTIRLPMDKAQRLLYRNEKNLLLDELPENCTISNGAVLTTRLRQTTSWPGLFIEGVAGPKFEWIYELCYNNPTEKIVVFSVFEKTVRGLVEYLRKNKINVVSITGQQEALLNDLNKRDFLNHNGVQVLVGTIGAMGQGYDGLQNVSHTLVFIDREWSPELMAQAEDRLHRMGQDNLVNVYYLECQGSFDQHVGRINKNKADDIRRALTYEESTST